MKILIKADDPDRLHLVLRPGSLALVGFGLAFLAAAAIVVWAMGYSTSLTVGGGRITYESRLMGIVSVEKQSIPLHEITGVEVRLNDSWAPQYDIVIDHERGALRAAFMLLNGDDKAALAADLTTVLADPNGRFAYYEDATLVTLILAGACAIGGIICLMALQRVEVMGDRPAGLLVVHRLRSIGNKADRTELPLSAFRSIRIARSTIESINAPTSYRLEIRREGNAPVPLSHGPVFTEASAASVKQLIEDWVRQAR